MAVARSSAIESSPVVVDGTAYVGAHDGRLFAVIAKSGKRVRWAYDTGGRINASPSVYGDRICITTYAGSIFCLNARTGEKIWSTYVRRDAFRYHSFYSSPSTDGARLYTVSRSGTVVALDATDGDILWSHGLGGWGYPTPAVTASRIFIGAFDGSLRAFQPGTGRELWKTEWWSHTRLARRDRSVRVRRDDGSTNLALSVEDGRIVWRLRFGKYTPVIATEKTYYFSFNGRLMAFRGRNATTS